MSLGLFYQLLIAGIVGGSTYAILAVSFGIIYSTTRIFHFAHAVVYTVAAYGAVLAKSMIGLPLPAAIVVGVVFGVITGLGVELLAYRPLRNRGAGLLPIFLASLGLSIAGPKVLQLIFGTSNYPLPGLNISTYGVGPTVTFTNLHIITIVASWASIGLLMLFLRRTKYGRATRAAQSNPQMAMAVGIRMDQVNLIVFALGSALVSIAAILFTLGGVASPYMGMQPVLIGFIGVFFGGIGTVVGAGLGGFALGLAISLSGLVFTSDYAPAVVFGLLFLLLIVRPTGLLGKAAR